MAKKTPNVSKLKDFKDRMSQTLETNTPLSSLNKYQIRLKAKELKLVLAQKNPLLIGVNLNFEAQVIEMLLSNNTSINAQFSELTIPGDGTSPDFQKVSIVDHGQTLKLGKYEAAIDSFVNYQYDNNFSWNTIEDTLAKTDHEIVAHNYDQSIFHQDDTPKDDNKTIFHRDED